MLEYVPFGSSKVHEYQEPSIGLVSLQVVLREDCEIPLPLGISTT